MKSIKKFSVRKRITSFIYAFNGLRIVALVEHNFRIHMLAAALVVLAGFCFSISHNEWIAIILIIVLVLSLEIMNSAIERLADVVSPERNEKIKEIKDMSAGAVLLAAIASLVIAGIIFLPKMGF